MKWSGLETKDPNTVMNEERGETIKCKCLPFSGNKCLREMSVLVASLLIFLISPFLIYPEALPLSLYCYVLLPPPRSKPYPIPIYPILASRPQHIFVYSQTHTTNYLFTCWARVNVILGNSLIFLYVSIKEQRQSSFLEKEMNESARKKQCFFFCELFRL